MATTPAGRATSVPTLRPYSTNAKLGKLPCMCVYVLRLRLCGCRLTCHTLVLCCLVFTFFQHFNRRRQASLCFYFSSWLYLLIYFFLVLYATRCCCFCLFFFCDFTAQLPSCVKNKIINSFTSKLIFIFMSYTAALQCCKPQRR